MPHTRIPKMLFVLQLPPPFHGASLMNSYVVNSKLIRDNIDIDVINLQFAKSIQELEKFSLLKVFKSFFFGFKILFRVLSQKPDLVYFTLSPKGYAFYRDAFYVFLLKLMRRKIIFHLHSQGIRVNTNNNLIKKWLYKRVFKNTYVICLAKSLVKDIVDVYTPEPFIVPNGIQIHPITVRNVPQRDETIPRILFLSNYIRNKGVLTLIEALAILKNQGYKFNARLVGAPSDLTVEMLVKIINDQHLTEFVTVTGPIFGDQKVVEFQEAEIFVFPTLNDAFPLVLLEAMQFKLPIISTYEGGIPEIVINNETGFLIETKNTQLLVDKIAILLKDKNMRIEMGKSGFVRFMENYTIEQYEKNMLKIFQSILSIF
jgi:glycosyltransferase involved in cell wall biosynthesis